MRALLLKRITIAACAAMAAGLASTPAWSAGAYAGSPSDGDPWESFNRSMFDLGMKLDRALARPVARAYISMTTQSVRNGVHNVLQNLDEPIVFVNDVLQGRPRRAGRTVARFLSNSTLGVGGIMDFAAKAGVPQQDNDFGATLAHFGVGSGPYLFVPLIGPSTVRDLTGGGVDLVADPVNHVRFRHATAFDIARTGMGAVDARASVDSALSALDTSAADPYATVRSVYRQKRAADLSNGRSAMEDLPDLPADEPPAAPSPPALPPEPAKTGTN